MRKSPQGSKASNQPVQDTNLVDALNALPIVLKVPSLDTWQVVLRKRLDWTDETQEGSPHLSAQGTHPLGSSTQERDKGKRNQAEVPQGRPPQDHADSIQRNNPRKDKGLRSDLLLYHNGKMDEANMEEIESRITDILQEEGEPSETSRSCNPCNQSLSLFLLIPRSRYAAQTNCKINIKYFVIYLNLEEVNCTILSVYSNYKNALETLNLALITTQTLGI
jgi:hypothetical protein